MPKVPDLLQGPNKELHPLVTKGNLHLLAWIVSGKGYLQREYERNLPLFSQMLDDQAQSRITNRPGVSGMPGLLGRQIDPIKCPFTHILDFLTECFREGF